MKLRFLLAATVAGLAPFPPTTPAAHAQTGAPGVSTQSSRCTSLAEEWRGKSNPTPQQRDDIRRRASSSGCGPLVTVIDASATSQAGRGAPSQSATCPPRSQQDRVFAGNDRLDVENLAVDFPGCAEIRSRTRTWMAAHASSGGNSEDMPSVGLPAGIWQNGTWDPRDLLVNDLYYEEYHIRLEPGQAISVTMRSDAAPPLLALIDKRIRAGGYQVLEEVSSDGGAETVLRWEAPPRVEAEEAPADPAAAEPADAEAAAASADAPDDEAIDYVLVAASTTPRRTGAYSLLLRFEQPVPPQPIALNTAIPGRLASDVPFDPFVFQGRAGQVMRISLASEAFDSYLVLGRRNEGGRFEQLATNDDGGEGQNSLINYVLDADGDYIVRARSLGRGGAGAYSLQVAALEPRNIPPEEVPRNANAWVIPGELTTESGIDPNSAFFQDFQFRTRANRRYAVSVQSDAITPILDLGQIRRRGEVNFTNTYRETASYDEAGNPVDAEGQPARESSARLEFTASNDGPYVFRVRTQGQAVGAFQILVTEAAPPSE